MDSSSALHLIEALSRLAEQQHRTVILSIHQPRPELFRRFHRVLLLAKGGRMVYAGACNRMIRYFERVPIFAPLTVQYEALEAAAAKAGDKRRLGAGRMGLFCPTTTNPGMC